MADLEGAGVPALVVVAVSVGVAVPVGDAVPVNDGDTLIDADVVLVSLGVFDVVLDSELDRLTV